MSFQHALDRKPQNQSVTGRRAASEFPSVGRCARFVTQRIESSRRLRHMTDEEQREKVAQLPATAGAERRQPASLQSPFTPYNFIYQREWTVNAVNRVEVER